MYTGILTGVVFLLHINLRFPNGLLEVALALIFLFVVGSGILGLVLSRILSRRLTTRGAEVIYERIPALRKELHEKVEDLVFEDKKESRSTVLGDFYLRHLVDFFFRTSKLYLPSSRVTTSPTGVARQSYRPRLLF
jgi:uncharacterized membrane protein